MQRSNIGLLAMLMGLGWSCAPQSHSFHTFGGPRVEIDDDDSRPPPAKPEVKKVTASEHATRFRTAALCEIEARNLHGSNRRYAWELLKACITRKDFTDIYRVMGQPWLEEIRRHPKDGIRSVAKLLANRGGNLKLDLAHCNDSGVQIFSLPDAMKNPSIFRGRYILMRGKVKEHAPGPSANEVLIAETSLFARNTKERYNWRSWRKMRKQGRGKAAYEGRRYRDKVVTSSQNVSMETNRQVRGLMEEKKELKIGTEYFVLLRFGDLKDAAEEEDRPMLATAAIVEAFAPPP